MKAIIHTLLLSFLSSASILAQQVKVNVLLEPFTINNLGGLQSFAHAQFENKWLLVGGRLDGLHRRQPFASFDVAGNNNKLIVVDPSTKQTWNVSLSELSINLQEQLSSTNIEYHQQGEYLYLFGGYGFHGAVNSRRTFPYVTAINLPGIINAIIVGNKISSHVRQIVDSTFAVTGGHVKQINDFLYLVGGNRFDGNYNPMGNPTYTQQYLDGAIKFQIHDNDTSFQIVNKSFIANATFLHRRDYNAVPQILPGSEKQAITAFSGVFQVGKDLPFLHAATLTNENLIPHDTFQQLFNHYHCANIPLYSAANQEMNTLFFGGIAQFYDSAGITIQDNNVPFVKTIAMVSRDVNGVLKEYKLSQEMPGFLGAGSEFLLNPGIPHYSNEVVKWDLCQGDTIEIGYIFGGINSTQKNIFFINDGTQSNANSTFYKVKLIKDKSTGISKLMNKPTILIYPNPADEEVNVQIQTNEQTQMSLEIINAIGTVLYKEENKVIKAGNNLWELHNLHLPKGQVYWFRFGSNQGIYTQKLILRR